MIFLYNILPLYKDAPEFSQISFQDLGSPISEQLVFFHDNIMFIILVILHFYFR